MLYYDRQKREIISFGYKFKTSMQLKKFKEHRRGHKSRASQINSRNE